MYEKSYYRGCKAGNFINNYLYKDEPKMSREERRQAREDNVYITLHGRKAFNQLSEYERKVRGYWE